MVSVWLRSTFHPTGCYKASQIKGCSLTSLWPPSPRTHPGFIIDYHRLVLSFNFLSHNTPSSWTDVMQLTPSFFLLLGSLFIMISPRVNAIPLTPPSKHINRSHRRLARMTGRKGPSAEVLEQLAVRETHIVSRSPSRIGYPVVKLGNSQDPSAAATPINAQALADNALTPANTPSTLNSLGLDIEANDVGFIATVQMGTPPRDFRLLMDSGSADLWVGSEGCVSENGTDCGNHVFLGPQSSSSFVDAQKTFQVTYGSGAVAGDIVTDDLIIAGLRLPGHTFGVATQESNDFSSSQTMFDGIMGLAQSTLSEQQTLTPVEALAKAGLIKEPITSFKIPRLADQKNDGEVTFGGLDTSKFDQTTLVTIENVNAAGFWEGAIDSVSLTDRILVSTIAQRFSIPAPPCLFYTPCYPGGRDAGNNGFTLPCTTNTSLAVTFGGRSFAIDPRDITFVPVDPNDPTGDCISGISAGQLGDQKEWLVGDVFLKNAYFSTDVGKNTIQLAKLL
ncbi:aspartic peptidase domain-containing protein [Multifurca ochricompacta]|uniref:Aspartic peptidase domain-containing protein n=1 Tax=Multifurca ochricompacta TaxID=376703 RepID=A0AAD4LW84_9AGAM|nr:aspartic peptidase domain-containing protein [Multifurca ochricompacta]